MGLNDLKNEASRDGGIKRIRPRFQEFHSYGRRDPVRRGDRAKGSREFRARCEGLH
jgi:hypothetical protein